MQKHVGHRLPDSEVAGAKGPKRSKVENGFPEWRELQCKDRNVNDNNGFDCRGYKLKAPGTVWLAGIVHQ